MFFEVIDTQTGKPPNLPRIALDEEWARGLVYCDITGFAITDDGCLFLIDDCNNTAFPPYGRFKIVSMDLAHLPHSELST